MYFNIKTDNNGIGEKGFKYLEKAQWKSLQSIIISNVGSTKVTMR